MRKIVLSIAAMVLAGCASKDKASDTEGAEMTQVEFSGFDTDAHLYLEEVEGEQALDWVRTENERSLARLKADPRFAELQAEALAIANAKERIPYGTVRDGQVYNFWQDETHVRGLWRRTPLESYRRTNPVWETVLDFDKLAEEEGKNWVYKGANCFHEHNSTKQYCMVSLSDGGKDAVIQREFDLETKSFVADGFVTPEAKQALAWINRNTVLIGTDWGEGTTTESGYPYIIKEWKRGTPLSDAVEVIRGDKTDVGVWPMTMKLDNGAVVAGAVKAETFFTATYWWLPGTEPVQWPIPMKSTPQGLFLDQMILTLEEDWAPEGQSESFKQGDLVSFDAAYFLKSKGDMPKVELVFRPAERQAIEAVSLTQDALLITYNDNVAKKITRGLPGKSGWVFSDVPLPTRGSAGVAFADKDSDTVFLNYEGFLTPDSYYEYAPIANSVTKLKSLPARFDASPYVVEQFEATSRDGTLVPYFVVRAKDTVMDGTTPTLQYAYGGFQVSMNPGYSGYVGKMWLDNGGAYILANIRGGGEFGPAWHQAGLKTRRQVVYDDFIAVSEDAIDRGLTSPEKLGIMGGSNGGLLMGVMFIQRPDLWSAVVCQVPLLDMLRYHLLLAGASWVDEYGSPDVPEERAWLEQLSPYHNVDPGTDYPEIFFVTSTKDDRVHPGHARKMAHRLQDLGKPFLYYENIDGGHSAAANLTEAAHRRALEYTYLMQKLMD